MRSQYTRGGAAGPSTYSTYRKVGHNMSAAAQALTMLAGTAQEMGTLIESTISQKVTQQGEPVTRNNSVGVEAGRTAATTPVRKRKLALNGETGEPAKPRQNKGAYNHTLDHHAHTKRMRTLQSIVQELSTKQLVQPKPLSSKALANLSGPEKRAKKVEEYNALVADHRACTEDYTKLVQVMNPLLPKQTPQPPRPAQPPQPAQPAQPTLPQLQATRLPPPPPPPPPQTEPLDNRPAGHGHVNVNSNAGQLVGVIRPSLSPPHFWIAQPNIRGKVTILLNSANEPMRFKSPKAACRAHDIYALMHANPTDQVMPQLNYPRQVEQRRKEILQMSVKSVGRIALASGGGDSRSRKDNPTAADLLEEEMADDIFPGSMGQGSRPLRDSAAVPNPAISALASAQVSSSAAANTSAHVAGAMMPPAVPISAPLTTPVQSPAERSADAAKQSQSRLIQQATALLFQQAQRQQQQRMSNNIQAASRSVNNSLTLGALLQQQREQQQQQQEQLRQNEQRRNAFSAVLQLHLANERRKQEEQVKLMMIQQMLLEQSIVQQRLNSLLSSCQNIKPDLDATITKAVQRLQQPPGEVSPPVASSSRAVTASTTALAQPGRTILQQDKLASKPRPPSAERALALALQPSQVGALQFTPDHDSPPTPPQEGVVAK